MHVDLDAKTLTHSPIFFALPPVLVLLACAAGAPRDPFFLTAAWSLPMTCLDAARTFTNARATTSGSGRSSANAVVGVVARTPQRLAAARRRRLAAHPLPPPSLSLLLPRAVPPKDGSSNGIISSDVSLDAAAVPTLEANAAAAIAAATGGAMDSFAAEAAPVLQKDSTFFGGCFLLLGLQFDKERKCALGTALWLRWKHVGRARRGILRPYKTLSRMLELSLFSFAHLFSPPLPPLRPQTLLFFSLFFRLLRLRLAFPHRLILHRQPQKQDHGRVASRRGKRERERERERGYERMREGEKRERKKAEPLFLELQKKGLKKTSLVLF